MMLEATVEGAKDTNDNEIDLVRKKKRTAADENVIVELGDCVDLRDSLYLDSLANYDWVTTLQ